MTMRATLLAIGTVALLAACGDPKAEAPAPVATADVPVETVVEAPAEAAADVAVESSSTNAAPAPNTAATLETTAAPAGTATPETAVEPTGLAALPAPYNEANLEDGKGQFAKCRNCHSLVAEDGHKIGPNLHGVFSRHPGSAPGFKYSPAMAANPHEAWSPHDLDEWLEKPTEFLPGNAMFFNGVKSEKDRRDLIAYVMIESAK